MARVISGRISGRVGDMVYRLGRDGKNYVSSLPKKSIKDPSEGQLNQQAKMKMAIRMLSELKGFFSSRPATYIKYFGRSSVMSHILKEVIVGSYPHLDLDLAKFSATKGAVATPQIVELCLIEPGIMQVSFTQCCSSNAYSNDELLVFAADADERIIRPLSIGEFSRSESVVRIQIPPSLQHGKTYFWFAYQSQNLQQCSRCSCVGYLDYRYEGAE